MALHELQYGKSAFPLPIDIDIDPPLLPLVMAAVETITRYTTISLNYTPAGYVYRSEMGFFCQLRIFQCSHDELLLTTTLIRDGGA